MNKEDLKKVIINIAIKKGIETPEMGDLTNKELVELFDTIKSDDTNDSDVLPQHVVVAEKHYVVAPGKSLTCMKGVLIAGDEIKPEYINGGDQSFMLLVREGYVAEAEEKE